MEMTARETSKKGGMIRFVGGPLHNSVAYVRTWDSTITVCTAAGYDDFWQLTDYQLRELQTDSCIWLEYHWKGLKWTRHSGLSGTAGRHSS